MSHKERSVLRIIWKYFIGSLKLPKQHKLIGEDYYGTKYYEIPVAEYSSRKRPSRYFVPVNESDHEQELPAEWESWLRNRRIDPPTKEEIEMNYRIAIGKKMNAAQIEATYSSARMQKPQLFIEKKGQESFPKYKEYENTDQDCREKEPHSNEDK